MQRDPIRGNTIRLTFDDGPMAGRSIDHIFDEGGSVSWRMADSAAQGKPTPAKRCAIAPIDGDVWGVAYLAESGYTLTILLNFRTHRLVAFSSNDKELGVQQGTFETKARGDVGPVSGWSPRAGVGREEAPVSIH